MVKFLTRAPAIRALFATRRRESTCLGGRTRIQGAMLYRLLCTYAPSQLLLLVIAGVGTFIGGLQFVVVFLAATAVFRLGDMLDHYGQRSHDS